MKVLCINDDPGKTTREKPKFKVGDTVTATQSKHYANGYNIAEDLFTSAGILRAWDKDRFIPLSNIDETTFKREYANQCS